MSPILDSDPNCPLCEGDGWLEDPCRQQTHQCPLCIYEKPEPFPLSIRGWIQDYHHVEAYHKGPPFRHAPKNIIMHRGVTGGDIARYFQSGVKGDGRKVSAHFVVQNNGEVIQCVSIETIAYHIGTMNSSSIGIETQGPINSAFPKEQISSCVELVKRLKQLLPSLTRIYGHSFLNPKRRTDPGKNFPWSKFRGLGLDGPEL